MLIVFDIQDVYTPLQTDVIVQLDECREHLDLLLESIPTMFQNNKTAESAFGAEIKLVNLLKNGINPQTQTPKHSDNLQINLKLNNQNYALWTRMIRVAIGRISKALLSHLTSDPPSQDNESYEQWEQEDLIVFSWLIQNIEPTIAGNLTKYPTAKMLRDALVVTYSSGRDKLQTLNLHVKANDIKQNDSPLEELWITLKGVWEEIDRIDPNPMKCPDDIKAYAKIRSEQKLFQFLNALDRKYESIRREILRSESLPFLEATYATVRKEAAHQSILGANNHESQGIAVGLAATEAEGVGLATKGYHHSGGERMDQQSKRIKHTKNVTIVGNKGLRSERGKAPIVNNESNRKNATGFGIYDYANMANINKLNHEQSWIFDCGATDTMTYDSSDFSMSTKPTKSYIQTANGEKINVENGGTIEISSTLKLSNCLYDIRTGAIIGRGTERQGLYYVDEVAQNGTVLLSHGTKEREAWLWHRRLGHPSTGYLHMLFPKKISSN
nr:ribonuclease H-like domain-containing protein [Tanacetum cinerariifolium]